MSSHENIPECPYENLKRMESISARFHRDLERVLRQQASTKQKLKDLRDKPLPEDATDRDKKQRAMLERKHQYDLRLFGREIGKLRGQISWADERQIPFIKEEIALLETEDEGEGDQEAGGAGA